jgi:hypothetical protein
MITTRPYLEAKYNSSTRAPEAKLVLAKRFISLLQHEFESGGEKHVFQKSKKFTKMMSLLEGLFSFFVIILAMGIIKKIVVPYLQPKVENLCFKAKGIAMIEFLE